MKHSDALQCCLLVLSMFDCGKGYNAENDEKHWAHQRVQMSHQSQAGFLFLEITEPSNLIVDMGRSIPAILNYTIPCQDKKSIYILGVQSSNNDVFVLKGNTTFEVTCEDAVKIDLIFSEQNVSVNEVVSYSTNHSSKTLAAKGSVRVDINGILLGIASMDVKLNNGDMSTSDVKESINGSVVAEKSFTVGVVRPITLVDQVFRIVIGVVISLVLLGFGCGLNLEVVKECLKKPIAPGIGLGCQYILMPLVMH